MGRSQNAIVQIIVGVLTSVISAYFIWKFGFEKREIIIPNEIEINQPALSQETPSESDSLPGKSNFDIVVGGTYKGACHNKRWDLKGGAVLIINQISHNEIEGELIVYGDLTGGSKFKGRIEGNEITFKTINQSDSQMELIWIGAVSGKRISGEYVVYYSKNLSSHGVWEVTK
jgi:hypothetical protein